MIILLVVVVTAAADVVTFTLVVVGTVVEIDGVVTGKTWYV